MSLPDIITSIAGNACPAQIPSLPQHHDAEARKARAFQLSIARTQYNYMQSYLEGVPLSADLPDAEKFSLDYEAQVVQVFLALTDNFKRVVLMLLERELLADVPTAALRRVEEAYAKLSKDFSILRPLRDIEELKDFFEALAGLPAALETLGNLPKDLAKMAVGLDAVFKEFLANGPTAFLKSTLFDMLSEEPGRNYLQAQGIEDYERLFVSLPTPLMLSIQQQPWMPQGQGKPCQQDWFFGWLQTAGYNTTMLRAVVPAPVPPDVDDPMEGIQKMPLADLLAKMPVTDAMLQKETGQPSLTLAQAAEQGRLFVCDYALLEGAWADPLHGEQRYMAAPIALFYWNTTPPAGYPSLPEGVLQPIAVQLAQQHDPETAPIYTPKDAGHANDANGFKWRIAKYFVNVAAAIQHEAIAHLGACHLIIEPIVVAARRQLAEQHPILKLLAPHFRFTININDSAIHSLIIPGGVVATNVGPAIECTLGVLAQAHQAYRWDDNHPERLFRIRGVDGLPKFPFRDDTMLLWQATHRFVERYLRLYYSSDAEVAGDNELQGWIHEMTAPQFAGFKGMRGLTATGDAKRPWRIDSLAYLIEVVAQIIYIAGPQHASVNYAQYPLMSYMPSVAGTLYDPAPARSTVVNSEQDCIRWYPPLDVSLYTFSFEYLLSGVQYDTFGHYEHNPRNPYFQDPRVGPLVAEFQTDLALAEREIRERNRLRPVEYPFQLPSQIPNSISI